MSVIKTDVKVKRRIGNGGIESSQMHEFAVESGVPVIENSGTIKNVNVGGQRRKKCTAVVRHCFVLPVYLEKMFHVVIITQRTVRYFLSFVKYDVMYYFPTLVDDVVCLVFFRPNQNEFGLNFIVT